DNSRNAELLHVLDVTAEVQAALDDCIDVFLAEIVLFNAAVHLERTDSRDDHGCCRLEASLAALDVEELLSAKISAEARFGDDVVSQLESGRRSDNRVAAVRDVGER